MTQPRENQRESLNLRLSALGHTRSEKLPHGIGYTAYRAGPEPMSKVVKAIFSFRIILWHDCNGNKTDSVN